MNPLPYTPTSFCSVGVLVLTPVISFHLRTPITAWRTHDPRLPVLLFDNSSTTPHSTEFTTRPLALPSLSFFNATSPLMGNDLLSLIKIEEVQRLMRVLQRFPNRILAQS
ncbi:unnamed protein product, partial [Iphiclides podalirius]